MEVLLWESDQLNFVDLVQPHPPPPPTFSNSSSQKLQEQSSYLFSLFLSGALVFYFSSGEVRFIIMITPLNSASLGG